MEDIFPKAKDFNWNIGLNVSFSLFEGSLKFAEHQKAREELIQLEVEKEAVQERKGSIVDNTSDSDLTAFRTIRFKISF